jgi:uncharacterized protein involved in exopolysaccharide biosynthesis
MEPSKPSVSNSGDFYQSSTHSSELDLIDLLKSVYKQRLLVVLITVICALIAAGYLIFAPVIYRSDILLVPAVNSSDLGVSGGLGSLAALAGVNIGGDQLDKPQLAVEILKSRKFIANFIEKYDLYYKVLAVESWNKGENELVIDKNIYDGKSWLEYNDPNDSTRPSIQKSVHYFRQLFSVSVDKNTQLITITVEHYSPFIAKVWASELVNQINEDMRLLDLAEANQSLIYLEKQISNTNNSDMKELLFSLVEEQTKTIVLANIRKEYVFKVIDPAIVSEKKYKPFTLLILIGAVFFGVFCGIVTVLFRILLFPINNQND